MTTMFDFFWQSFLMPVLISSFYLTYSKLQESSFMETLAEGVEIAVKAIRARQRTLDQMTGTLSTIIQGKIKKALEELCNPGIIITPNEGKKIIRETLLREFTPQREFFNIAIAASLASIVGIAFFTIAKTILL